METTAIHAKQVNSGFFNSQPADIFEMRKVSREEEQIIKDTLR